MLGWGLFAQSTGRPQPVCASPRRTVRKPLHLLEANQDAEFVHPEREGGYGIGAECWQFDGDVRWRIGFFQPDRDPIAGLIGGCLQHEAPKEHEHIVDVEDVNIPDGVLEPRRSTRAAIEVRQDVYVELVTYQ